MKTFKIWFSFCFILLLSSFHLLRADTEIDGTALTSSSFTFNGPVLISSLTVSNNLAVSTITAVSSATITSMTITNKLTVPNGVNLTDVAAFGQIGVYQTVGNTSTSSKSTTSTSFVATNLSATITPQSSSHHVLVMACGIFEINNGSTANGFATLERGTTNLGGTNGFMLIGSNEPVFERNPTCMIYLDSPNSTSSQTYGVSIRTSNSSVGIQWGDSANDVQSIVLLETS